MILTKARRQQLILSWIGIGLGWAAVVGGAVLVLAEWLALLVPASTVGAVGVGTLITRRICTPKTRASIKVDDLHPTLGKGSKRR